jgi:hypothetical protein
MIVSGIMVFDDGDQQVGAVAECTESRACSRRGRR